MFLAFLQTTSVQFQQPDLTPYYIVGLIAYLFAAFCLMTIANKTGTPNGWFAFIPILNIILMLQIADKPIWWIILFIIPIVNIIIAILVWMGIAEKRGKPSWWGILFIIPILNIVALLYLAFAD